MLHFKGFENDDDNDRAQELNVKKQPDFLMDKNESG
jgi:hypothetical protein